LEYFPKDENGQPDFLLIVEKVYWYSTDGGMYAGDHIEKKPL
jgi:hypothetical protein